MTNTELEYTMYGIAVGVAIIGLIVIILTYRLEKAFRLFKRLGYDTGESIEDTKPDLPERPK